MVKAYLCIIAAMFGSGMTGGGCRRPSEPRLSSSMRYVMPAFAASFVGCGSAASALTASGDYRWVFDASIGDNRFDFEAQSGIVAVIHREQKTPSEPHACQSYEL